MRKEFFMLATLSIPFAGAASASSIEPQNKPAVSISSNYRVPSLPNPMSEYEMEQTEGEIAPLLLAVATGAAGGAGWYVGEKIVNSIWR